MFIIEGFKLCHVIKIEAKRNCAFVANNHSRSVIRSHEGAIPLCLRTVAGLHYELYKVLDVESPRFEFYLILNDEAVILSLAKEFWEITFHIERNFRKFFVQCVVSKDL